MNRIYHPWNKWECFKSGFYGPYPKGIKKNDAEKMYKNFLSNINLFEETLKKVISEWRFSCEHNLSNKELNRIAWLGQAACAYYYKIPSDARAGFNLLTENEQLLANKVAEKYLNIWLERNKNES